MWGWYLASSLVYLRLAVQIASRSHGGPNSVAFLVVTCINDYVGEGGCTKYLFIKADVIMTIYKYKHLDNEKWPVFQTTTPTRAHSRT